MPDVVRRQVEAYGSSRRRYLETASVGELALMEEVWDWINDLPKQVERQFLYAWSWVKVRKGLTISRFAEENYMNERTLRRAVTVVCQSVADNLNRACQVRLSIPDCVVSESSAFSASNTVSSESCATEWRDSDARPHIDPALPKSRVLAPPPRKIRARPSDKNRSLSVR
ncbi:hypothetical protein BSY16_1143 [Sinorhizobium sp. RAC02]|nr:hypothetical protein BSY16_1143 [Sinorhizobium sp. RAC02]